MVKPSEKISDPTALGTGLDELVIDSGARIRKDAFCSGAVVVVGVDDTEFEMFDLSAHVERLQTNDPRRRIRTAERNTAGVG